MLLILLILIWPNLHPSANSSKRKPIYGTAGAVNRARKEKVIAETSKNPTPLYRDSSRYIAIYGREEDAVDCNYGYGSGIAVVDGDSD